MISRSIPLWLGSSCAAAFATAAHAQNNDAAAAPANPPAAAAEPDTSSAEIIVTAQKRQQRLLDVPQSISVISGKDLEATHAQRLSDYLTRIPSANIVESQA